MTGVSQNTTSKQTSHGFQVENHHFRVREIERTGGSVGVRRIGPACKVTGAVLVPGRSKDQGNAGQLLYHDLLQAVESLLLLSGIGGGGILRRAANCANADTDRGIGNGLTRAGIGDNAADA